MFPNKAVKSEKRVTWSLPSMDRLSIVADPARRPAQSVTESSIVRKQSPPPYARLQRHEIEHIFHQRRYSPHCVNETTKAHTAPLPFPFLPSQIILEDRRWTTEEPELSASRLVRHSYPNSRSGSSSSNNNKQIPGLHILGKRNVDILRQNAVTRRDTTVSIHRLSSLSPPRKPQRRASEGEFAKLLTAERENEMVLHHGAPLEEATPTSPPSVVDETSGNVFIVLTQP